MTGGREMRVAITGRCDAATHDHLGISQVDPGRAGQLHNPELLLRASHRWVPGGVQLGAQHHLADEQLGLALFDLSYLAQQRTLLMNS